MKYFIHAFGPSGILHDTSGLEFSDEEQALKEILSNLYEVVDEMQEDCEALPFDRVDITDEHGRLIRSVSVTDLLSGSGRT
jgi:hypothetical protein